MFDLPPIKYDYVYHGTVVELVMSADEVQKHCGNPHALACMLPPITDGGTCVIWLPRTGVGGVSVKTQELLRRHEIGHCNGWQHNPN